MNKNLTSLQFSLYCAGTENLEIQDGRSL